MQLIQDTFEDAIQKAKNGGLNEKSSTKADELKKYKELLDMGAITPEEYEKKKKELLN